MSPRARVIALVDDEPAIVHVVQKALRRHGDRVLVARSVAEGHDLVAQFNGAFDCAIIDLTLPDGNGLSLADEIHSAYPRIRIVLTTGGENPVTTDFGVLLKPFTFEELWASIA